MKKKNPELDFSPQANMLHLLKSAKSMALTSPKRNTVVVQPSILDVMTGKGNMTLSHFMEYILSYIHNKIHRFYPHRAGNHGTCDNIAHTYRGYLDFSIQSTYADLKVTPFPLLWTPDCNRIDCHV